MGLDMYMKCYTRHNPKAIKLLNEHYMREDMRIYFNVENLDETELKLRIVTILDPNIENNHDPLTDIYHSDYIEKLFYKSARCEESLKQLDEDYEKALNFFNATPDISKEMDKELTALKEKFPDIETFENSNLLEQIEDFSYYWRKANHIHAYFVSNVQGGVDDQDKYEVTEEQLLHLKSVLESAISTYESAELSEEEKNEELEEILPCQEGFFFGDTSFDEYYHENNKETLEYVNRVLEEMDFEKNMLFYTCWW